MFTYIWLISIVNSCKFPWFNLSRFCCMTFYPNVSQALHKSRNSWCIVVCHWASTLRGSPKNSFLNLIIRIPTLFLRGRYSLYLVWIILIDKYIYIFTYIYIYIYNVYRHLRYVYFLVYRYLQFTYWITYSFVYQAISHGSFLKALERLWLGTLVTPVLASQLPND